MTARKFASIIATLESNSESGQEMTPEQVIEHEDELQATMESYLHTARQLNTSLNLLHETRENINQMDELSDAGLEIANIQLQSADVYVPEEDRLERNKVLASMVEAGASNKEVAMEAFGATISKAFPILKMLLDLLKRAVDFIKRKLAQVSIAKDIDKISEEVKALNNKYGTTLVNKPISEALKDDSHAYRLAVLHNRAKLLRMSTMKLFIQGGDFNLLPSKVQEITLISKNSLEVVKHSLQELSKITAGYLPNSNGQSESMRKELDDLYAFINKEFEKLLDGSNVAIRDIDDDKNFTRDAEGIPSTARYYYAFTNSSGAAIWKEQEGLIASMLLYYEPIAVDHNIEPRLSISDVNSAITLFKRGNLESNLDSIGKYTAEREKMAQQSSTKLSDALNKINQTDPDVSRDIRGVMLSLISYVKAVNTLSSMAVTQASNVVEYLEACSTYMSSAYANT